jgi:NAD(P)-dependent dehydrogenase (short-subunit alcohol dehydrogenase family)
MTDRKSVAVVTGATGNLGQAVIARLRAAGALVVGVERAEVRYGAESLGPIDLGDPELVKSSFARIAERFSAIDAVVHTVGTYRGGPPLLETAQADFEFLFQTNVITTANVVRAALALMLPRACGSIAVVGSADALAGAPGHSAYAASKAAQLRMIESVAAECRGRGVSVNAVLPTIMDTPQNRAAMPNADRSRWVSLSAVADVLAYLVSPAASAVNGQAIKL